MFQLNRCANPMNMRGHFVDTLDPKFLVCTEEPSYAQLHMPNVYIFYLTFFMMCSIFCVAIILYRYRFAAPQQDRHSSIYYLKAQTEGNWKFCV